VSAYLHPGSGRLTIVAVNRSSSGKAINLSIRNLADQGSLYVYRTSAVEDAAYIESVAVSVNNLSYELPAESVTTFTSRDI